jgi:hypothetical protein
MPALRDAAVPFFRVEVLYREQERALLSVLSVSKNRSGGPAQEPLKASQPV